MQDNRKLIFLVLTLVILVAISGVVILNQRGSGSNELSTEPAKEEIVAIDTQVVTPEENIAENYEEATLVVAEETEEPPATKTGLESTDPKTVNLASGSIQLVELFAFW